MSSAPRASNFPENLSDVVALPRATAAGPVFPQNVLQVQNFRLFIAVLSHLLSTSSPCCNVNWVP